MSLIENIGLEDEWRAYYLYKESCGLPKSRLKRLKEYIDCKRYLTVLNDIEFGTFPLARKSVISKAGSDKRRTVYTYPEPHNTALKLLTYLIIRKYDRLFEDNLYSFRPSKTAKDAVRRLVRETDKDPYVYKVDISNYFNSIDPDLFLPKLRTALEDDSKLFSFLESLLTEERVLEKGNIIYEKKGIMAGTPQSSFFANLYLSDLDKHFSDLGVSYARYSDDIIVFCKSRDEAELCKSTIAKYLKLCRLEVNPAKEIFFPQGAGWEFLGFKVEGRIVDVSPVTKNKLKAKMRRKARALVRWKERNGHSGEYAAKAFIRVFNNKLFGHSETNELSWNRWFFSVINTDSTLNEIDLYAQDCIRFIISGKRTKKRFDVKYEDIKRLGYKSLVHEYYSYK